MGTSMFWTGPTKLFDETLGKLEGWLAAEGYVGSIDLNCIVNDTGVYPLEFTPRFEYPTITLQEEAFESGTEQFFYDLAHGNDPELQVDQGYQIGVRVVLPPFPSPPPETVSDHQKPYPVGTGNSLRFYGGGQAPVAVFGSLSGETVLSGYCRDVPVRPHEDVRSIRNRPTIMTTKQRGHDDVRRLSSWVTSSIGFHSP
jgi:hypothetical protein